MDNNILPPPIPWKRNMSFGKKIFLLGLQSAVLMIGVFVIWIIIYSREARSENVTESIYNEWGGSVAIDGPYISLCDGNDVDPRVNPESLNSVVNVDTRSLHRNIYDVVVYDARVHLSGTFNKADLSADRDTVCIRVGVPAHRVSKLNLLKIGGKEVKLSIMGDWISAKVDISDMPQTFEFDTDFEVRGSGEIMINRIGKSFNGTVEGNAKNPSFNGVALPNSRETQSDRFFAMWEYDNSSVDEVYCETQGYIITSFLVGVDSYKMVNRSLKYSFLIILLTYLSVLFAEIFMKRNIPLFNYFLIGAALIIFYILLLSFSEHISFGFSYLIAATMTIVLISGYMWKMLGSAKVGIVIGAILILLYICCFILLSLATYALLMGSLVLFVALAAMMYGSLRMKR